MDMAFVWTAYTFECVSEEAAERLIRVLKERTVINQQHIDREAEMVYLQYDGGESDHGAKRLLRGTVELWSQAAFGTFNDTSDGGDIIYMAEGGEKVESVERDGKRAVAQIESLKEAYGFHFCPRVTIGRSGSQWARPDTIHEREPEFETVGDPPITN